MKKILLVLILLFAAFLTSYSQIDEYTIRGDSIAAVIALDLFGGVFHQTTQLDANDDTLVTTEWLDENYARIAGNFYNNYLVYSDGTSGLLRCSQYISIVNDSELNVAGNIAVGGMYKQNGVQISTSSLSDNAYIVMYDEDSDKHLIGTADGTYNLDLTQFSLGSIVPVNYSSNLTVGSAIANTASGSVFHNILVGYALVNSNSGTIQNNLITGQRIVNNADGVDIENNLIVGTDIGNTVTQGISNSIIVGKYNVYNTHGMTSGDRIVAFPYETFRESTVGTLNDAIGIGYRAGYQNAYSAPALFGREASATVNNQVVIGSSFYTGGILLDEEVTTSSPDFYIGDGTTTANKRIFANNGDTNLSHLRYNETSNKWEYTNDGTTFYEIGSGTGATTESVLETQLTDVTDIYTNNDGTLHDQEDIEDFLGGMLTGTQTGITVTYDDTNGEIDFVVSSGSSYTQEEIEDFVGAMVTGNSETNITVTYQDGDGTLDFSVADIWYNTLSELQSAVSNDFHNLGGTDNERSEEEIEDFVGGMLTGTQTGITVTYDDINGEFDFVVTSGSSYTQEDIEDIVGGMLTGTQTNITVSYDDANGEIDFVASGGGGGSYTASTGIEIVSDDIRLNLDNLSTALTSSNVSTGDRFAISDGGVEKYITAEQLSQYVRSEYSESTGSLNLGGGWTIEWTSNYLYFKHNGGTEANLSSFGVFSANSVIDL